MYAAVNREGNKIHVKFSHANGLMSKIEPIPGFSIAGSDQKWKWANAKIEGNEIVVWNDEIADPVAVRYAWADNPKATTLQQRRTSRRSVPHRHLAWHYD